jgi:membrane protein DedA with SNARE-associated domain/rhodanese-related sulfurtransferase
MDRWTTLLAQHGYAVLFAAVFLESIGLPVPAALVLLIAGAAAAGGALSVPYALGGSVLAMVIGDTLMFLMGRYTGWWLLGLLCRISLNPESCILRSAESFYRRGRTLLLFAKFIPGVNTMAPPLAGSMNMRLLGFFRLDVVGAALYIGAYFTLGYLFSGALQAVTRGYETFGRVLTIVIVTLVAAYALAQVYLWRKSRALLDVPSATPHDVARDLAAGAFIYDVRSHGYLDASAVRIRGSTRMDPNALTRWDQEFPSGGPIYLYCTCIREATSARVARELKTRFPDRAHHFIVLKGGLRAWRKAGLPVEPVPKEDLAILPLFD